jgi:hypothetical protein
MILRGMHFPLLRHGGLDPAIHRVERILRRRWMRGSIGVNDAVCDGYARE